MLIEFEYMSLLIILENSKSLYLQMLLLFPFSSLHQDGLAFLITMEMGLNIEQPESDQFFIFYYLQVGQ